MSGAVAEAPIDISAEHWEIIRDILRAHVAQCPVWAFGSRAKGMARPYSDLDLVIGTGQPMSLEVYAALREAFSESDLQWKVDVLDWAATSAAFRRIIERERVLIWPPAVTAGQTAAMQPQAPVARGHGPQR